VKGYFGPASVCEDVLPGWTFEQVYVDGDGVTPVNTDTDVRICVNVDNLKDQSVKFLNFKDVKVTLTGCKYDDAGNPVAGYPIDFSDGTTTRTELTGANGCVTIGPLPSGDYTISENTDRSKYLILYDFRPLHDTPCTFHTPAESGGDYYPDACNFTNTRSRPGRFTGGGSTSSLDLDNGRVRVTQGMELHCSASALPNNLEVNWGPGNRFHLGALTAVGCFDDPAIIPTPPDANFDTIDGIGVGSCNGVNGATIEFTLKDAGEPGTNDTASLKITCADGSVLTVSGTGSKVNKGNLQAHY